MASNASEWRGREYRSRERDTRRAPIRATSKERARSPSTVTAAGAASSSAAARGRALDSRAVTSSNTTQPQSPSTHSRLRSISPARHHGRDRSRHRPAPPYERRSRPEDDSSQGEKAGEQDKDSSERAERHQPSSAKRRYHTSPSPSYQRFRDSKRRRSRSRDTSRAPSRPLERPHSPRSTRHDNASRRESPDYYQSHHRRRSPSFESRHRGYPSRHTRRPSPEDRPRTREAPRDRYRSPPRRGRRRYSPAPPERRSHRHGDERDTHHRYEDYYGTRHSKPAAHSPVRDSRRSPSPSDLISQLATNRRREDAEASRQRRASRSPHPDRARRDYRDDARQRGRDRDRDYESSRGDYYNPLPRRDRHREEADSSMYGRGGYPRGPPPGPGRPYVDPRYNSHSPPYPPQGTTGPSPHHGHHSPYARGGYSAPQAYGSYQGSPVHAYSPQHSPYYPQPGYPPPAAASPYYQQQPSPPVQYAPPPVQQAYAHPPPQSFPSRPPPRHPSYGPSQRSAGPPAGAPRGRGGHFANLSWTPSTGSRGGKIVNTNGTPRAPSSSGAVTPAPAVPPTTASVDDDDNPFRPPRDLRAEDESKNEPKAGSKPGISFSIKGMAEKNPPSPPPMQMRKEIVLRKRLKPKPKLSEEFAASDSVYYRKIGNESVIGSGTYGKVYKAVHVYTNDKVALKKIRMEGERDGFPVTAIREIKLLQSLNHNNIVKLHEVMVERNDCFMVFEYLSHDLTGLLNHPSFTLTSAHKKHLAKQLFEGLDYLHKRGVLHRDIKAANILVSRDGELKLADFGLARFYNKNSKTQQDYTNRVITIWYRSPELLLGETQYGPAVDVWSAASVLVEIFTKHAIFPGDGSEINQLDKIYSVLGTPSRSDWPGITDLAWYELLRPTQKLPSTFAEKYKERLSPAAFDLLSAMFLYDPNARPSASDVLEHPYFTTEEPKPQRAWGLKDLEGEWHEYESKALRKEKEREARKKDREGAEKRKGDLSVVDDRENKKLKTSDGQA